MKIEIRKKLRCVICGKKSESNYKGYDGIEYLICKKCFDQRQILIDESILINKAVRIIKEND